MSPRLILLLSFIALPLFAAAPAGKSQQITSPDQVPQGLEKSDWASIRAAHTAWEHSFMPLEGGGFQARNKAQQWTTKFDGRGFLAKPKDADWQWGLELKSYGFGTQQTAVQGQPEVKANGQRLTYQWDAAVQEWFVNDQRGLEHGFTVDQRPTGAAKGVALELVLGTRGTLRASLAADAQTVYFRDEAGAPVVNYSGLKVWDTDGKVLPSRFVAGPQGSIVLRVEESGARYPLTIDPIAQQACLKPAASSLGYAGSSDQFGASVAVNGDTVVVGAIGEDSSSTGVNSTPDEAALAAGAAYVFVRSGTTWSQQAYLKASQVSDSDGFGQSVAISGDTLVVGAIAEDGSATGSNGTVNELTANSGAAYVFVRSGTVWSQQAYLKASQVSDSDQFGYSVAVNGNTVVVGSVYEDGSATGVNGTANELSPNSGAAYVFTRSGTTWSQQAYLKASQVTANDFFGYTVGLDGDIIVVGATGEDSSTTGINSSPNETSGGAGAAYVFVRSGTTWSQQAYLKASQVTPGDSFGFTVAVSGQTVIVGSPGEDSSTTTINSTANETADGAGAAYVFVRSGTTWSQQAYLKSSNIKAGDVFGYSVAVSGDTVVVGAYLEDSSTTGINSTPDESASSAGAAYVFVRSGTTWSQQAYLKASQVTAADQFGYSVAVSGDTVVVGANLEDSSATGINGTANEGAFNSGAAYVFVRSGTTWSQQAYMKPSADTLGYAGLFDQFGWAVAVSGDTVVVSANGEDSSSSGVNSTPNETAPNSGAAYVFVRTGTTWSQQAYLKASQVTAGDAFGYSVAISGDTVIVGVIQEDSGTTGINSTPDEALPASGAAYIFVRSGTTWSQQAYLKASQVTGNDQFGNSVSVSGDTAVVGAFGEDSSTTGINSSPNETAADAGAAYVFVRSGTTWSQQAYVKASVLSAGDQFGSSVAVSGDVMVVGAPVEDSSTTGVNSTPNESADSAGAAYVFVRSGTTWSQQAYLKASQVSTGDQFGIRVAASGDTVIIGAPYEDSSSTGINSTANEAALNSGAAYVFVRSGGTWTQQAYLKSNNVSVNDLFGFSVAASGDVVVVGAYGESSSTTGINSTADDFLSYTGAAYVYLRSGTAWTQQAYLKASQVSGNDNFGYSVAVSGGTVVAGVPFEDGSNPGINSIPNDGSPSSGAAYIFIGLGLPPTISSISPTSGSTAGGTSVTITGTGFSTATEATLGGLPLTNFNVVNATTITGTIPSRGPGLVSLEVTSPTGTGTRANAFTFLAPPVVSFVNPAGGSIAGGTSVTIYGSSFTGATAVSFGSTAATSFIVTSSTQISAVTPAAAAAGLVNVSVTANGEQTTGTSLYRYAPASNSTDADGDGLNDAAELYLSAFGFDPGTAQTAQVTSFLTGNAIFNQSQYDANRLTGRNDVINSPNTYDLYTTSQIQAMNFPTPLIKRDPVTGVFTLTLSVERSYTLMPGSFQNFSMTAAPGAVRTFNSEGRLEFQFTSPDNAAFFRLEAH